MSFGEQQDFKDARKQIAVVDQGGLGLPERDYYLRTGDADEKIRQQYVAARREHAEADGRAGRQGCQLTRKKIMDLETALAKISMDITSQRDPKNVYHLMPVSQLAGLTPEIDWTDVPRTHPAYPPITELNVANPDFFKGLNALLASTDLDTIKTYLRWQLINGTPSYTLPEAMDEEQFDFYGRKLRGQPEQRARWKRCVQATDGALGEALGQVYVEGLLPAGEQGSHGADGPRHRGRDGQGHRHARLDEPGDQGQGQGKAAPRRRQDRLSRPVARLFQR